MKRRVGKISPAKLKYMQWLASQKQMPQQQEQGGEQDDHSDVNPRPGYAQAQDDEAQTPSMMAYGGYVGEDEDESSETADEETGAFDPYVSTGEPDTDHNKTGEHPMKFMAKGGMVPFAKALMKKKNKTY